MSKKEGGKDYRQALTDRLIEQLEAGTAPWQKPWDGTPPAAPFNPTTGANYKGINSLALSTEGRDDPRWMTFKQAKEQGWTVKNGEHGTQIECWKFNGPRTMLDKDSKPVLDKAGKPVKQDVRYDTPRVFTATVFNAAQIDGIPPLDVKPLGWNPSDRAEAILVGSGAVIQHDQSDRAFYRRATDEIHLPARERFDTPGAYYSTALHELGHWTGHESRLNRDAGGEFGTPGYAREELRAEMSSYFVSSKLGVPHDPAQHAAYVSGWIDALKSDKNEIVRAARDAEKISDYVIGLDRSQEVTEQKRSIGELRTEARTEDRLLSPEEVTKARAERWAGIVPGDLPPKVRGDLEATLDLAHFSLGLSKADLGKQFQELEQAVQKDRGDPEIGRREHIGAAVRLTKIIEEKALAKNPFAGVEPEVERRSGQVSAYARSLGWDKDSIVLAAHQGMIEAQGDVRKAVAIFSNKVYGEGPEAGHLSNVSSDFLNNRISVAEGKSESGELILKAMSVRDVHEEVGLRERGAVIADKMLLKIDKIAAASLSDRDYATYRVMSEESYRIGATVRADSMGEGNGTDGFRPAVAERLYFSSKQAAFTATNRTLERVREAEAELSDKPLSPEQSKKASERMAKRTDIIINDFVETNKPAQKEKDRRGLGGGIGF